MESGQIQRPGRTLGTMSADAISARPTTQARRIRDLARRCRELSEMTAVPELTRELSNIANELEKEAEMAREE
jgi:hypothetical protein